MPCRACGGEQSSVFFRAPGVPIACNVLCATREAAMAAPRGEIALALCRACGLVYNQAFDERLLEYGGAYENALHFSAEFRRYAQDLAMGLVERHNLRGKRIVELGCGDGSFLSLLCGLGGNEGIGYDPAHDPDRSAIAPGVNVRVERRLYGPGTAPPMSDLVVCRHTLEHIPEPLAVLRSVRSAIGHSGAPVFFEVPDFAYTLEHDGIWDILYEHCNYFTRASLWALFERAGFTPNASHSVYGNQFLTIEATPTPAPAAELPASSGKLPEREAARLADLTAAFGRGYDEKVSRWRGVLGDLRRLGRTAALWGAGTKGVMFLNIMGGDAAAVSCVVDVNPRKHGCSVVGAGQRIVGPDELQAIRPDVVIVMNPVYVREITQMLSSLDIDAEVRTA